MTVRGVFFIFFLLCSIIINPCKASGAVDSSLTGSYDQSTKNWQNTLTNELALDITPKHKLCGRFIVTNNTEQLLSMRFTDWSFLTRLSAQQELELLYNKPHLTSTDMFRVLHQDYYSSDHVALVYRYDQRLLGLLGWEIPINNGLPSIVHYLQMEYPHKQINVKLTGMHYDTQHQWTSVNADSWDFSRHIGHIFVGEVKSRIAPCQIHLGYGCQKRAEELQTRKQIFSDRAWVCSTKTTLGAFKVNFALQHIGQDFNWPLTKTKPYAADRKGYTSQLRWKNLPWNITLSHNRFKNITATRSYDQTSLKLEYRQEKQGIFCTINLVPKQNMRFGYQNGAWKTEWQYLAPQIWLTYTDKDHEVKYTSSSFNRHRIEYQYTGYFSFKAVFKVDQNTNQHYWYGSSSFSDEHRHLTITYGEDDRGQIGAKFGHVPSLQLAWGWSW